MKVIETKNLTKTYRRFKKPEGLKGSLKSLWKREYIEKTAVKNLDFTLEEGEVLGSSVQMVHRFIDNFA